MNRCLVLAVLALSILVLPLSGHRPATVFAAGLQSQAGSYAGVGPIANWLKDIIDILEKIADDLEDGALAVGEKSGPLVEPELSRVASDLTDALDRIELILDSGQYPILKPPDAGKIDESVKAETLPEYAKQAHGLAKEAVAEASYGAVDDKVIGSRLKTIKHLITRALPHNYHTKAGITTG